jgi:hypothetical protein
LKIHIRIKKQLGTSLICCGTVGNSSYFFEGTDAHDTLYKKCVTFLHTSPSCILWPPFYHPGLDSGRIHRTSPPHLVLSQPFFSLSTNLDQAPNWTYPTFYTLKKYIFVISSLIWKYIEVYSVTNMLFFNIML